MTASDPETDGPDLDANGVDPALLGLPRPPRWRRGATIVLMTVVMAAALSLLLSLRADVAYFLSPTTAVELGNATEIDPARIEASNRYVRVRGRPMLGTVARYRQGLLGERYRVFALAGQRTFFVRVRDDAREVADLREEYSGRLVAFSDLGFRFRSVRQYLEGEMHLPVSGATFLLMADNTSQDASEAPRSYIGTVLLCLLCLGCLIVDCALMFRWFRPLPTFEPVPVERTRPLGS